MDMQILECHRSPDNRLVLLVVRSSRGEISVGFEGSEWHTHSDLLSHWLAVSEEVSVQKFVDLIKTDVLPIIISTDAGETFDAWVSDNFEESIRIYGMKNCILRYWSKDSAIVR